MIEKDLGQFIPYVVETYRPESPIIDFGCGNNKRFPGIYHGVDTVPGSDIVADVHDVPVANNTYSTAVSFDALEHFENPIKVVSEMVRVTKPGGLIIISTVFAWVLHEHPTDYFRFTASCLRMLLTKNNCDVLECDFSHPFGAGPYPPTMGVHVYAIGRKRI